MIQSIRVILPLLLFAALSYSSSGAQANKHNGYIITLSGDTLQGFILFTWKAEFTHSCKFKSEAETELNSYKAGELKAIPRKFGSFEHPPPQASFLQRNVTQARFLIELAIFPEKRACAESPLKGMRPVRAGMFLSCDYQADELKGFYVQNRLFESRNSQGKFEGRLEVLE